MNGLYFRKKVLILFHLFLWLWFPFHPIPFPFSFLTVALFWFYHNDFGTWCIFFIIYCLFSVKPSCYFISLFPMSQWEIFSWCRHIPLLLHSHGVLYFFLIGLSHQTLTTVCLHSFYFVLLINICLLLVSDENRR